MSNFIGTVIFSLIMGFSIFLSLPVLMRRNTGTKTLKLLNAAAIGILIFLLADVFSNATVLLYSKGSLYGYGASPLYSVVLAAGLAAGFFMLYAFEHKSKRGLTPTKMALMIAIGIGLQNLTEGLVFGSLSASVGLFSGVALVVLVGFMLQNMSEGFPIASPFISYKQKKLSTIVLLLLVGSLPAIIGGITGFYYSSVLFNLFFDGLAIGAILYVILPMIRHLFRDIDPTHQRVAYLGIFVGFLIGFLVNLI
jgi:ZIP family zinc transporter